MDPLEKLISLRMPLIADGGMGTLLQREAAAAGMPVTTPPETMLLAAPKIVRSIHAAYVQAGATILLTNTFACSRSQLEKRGTDSDFVEIHRIAAELARDAAGPDRFVFADLGPLGAFFPPMGTLTRDAAVAAYAERAAAMCDTRLLDGVLIETQYDLNEVECAIEGVRQATELPVAVTMSFDSHGRTMMGVSPNAFAQSMQDRGIAFVGANCGAAIEDTLAAIQKIAALLPDALLWAKPNAGLPEIVDGQEVYALDPGAFATAAIAFLDLGVHIFGGCCGTTPEHIAAAVRVLSPRANPPDVV